MTGLQLELAHLLLFIGILFGIIQCEWSGQQAKSKYFAQKTEIVYIVSGNGDLESNEQYQTDIKDIITVTSAQFDARKTRTAILLALDDHYMELVSEMTSIAKMKRNLIAFLLDLYLAIDHQPESDNAVAYARDNIFSRKNKEHLNQLAVLLVTSDLDIDILHDYLQDICTKIITFVLVHPKPKTICDAITVQKRIDYVNTLLNYTKLLNQEQAICSLDAVTTVDFQEAAKEAIDVQEEVQSYCKRNPHLRTLEDTDLQICVGFFCSDNSTLWIVVAFSTVIILILMLLVVRMYIGQSDRPISRPAKEEKIDYYSFLAEALAYHNQFLLAQSQCLYGSQIFKPPAPPRKKRTTSDSTSGATSTAQSITNTPTKKKTSGRYQKAPRRKSLSAQASTTVSPAKHSAPSSRRASVARASGITPKSSAANSRRTSSTSIHKTAGEGMRRNVTSTSLEASPRRFSPIDTKAATIETDTRRRGSQAKMLKQQSVDLPREPANVPRRFSLEPLSKHQKGGVKRGMKKSTSMNYAERSPEKKSADDDMNCANEPTDSQTQQLNTMEEPIEIASLGSESSIGATDLHCINEGSSENLCF